MRPGASGRLAGDRCAAPTHARVVNNNGKQCLCISVAAHCPAMRKIFHNARHYSNFRPFTLRGVRSRGTESWDRAHPLHKLTITPMAMYTF
jgi:hypothetical protein